VFGKGYQPCVRLKQQGGGSRAEVVNAQSVERKQLRLRSWKLWNPAVCWMITSVSQRAYASVTEPQIPCKTGTVM
jgi:hypothetical protein